LRASGLLGLRLLDRHLTRDRIRAVWCASLRPGSTATATPAATLTLATTLAGRALALTIARLVRIRPVITRQVSIRINRARRGRRGARDLATTCDLGWLCARNSKAQNRIELGFDLGCHGLGRAHGCQRAGAHRHRFHGRAGGNARWQIVVDEHAGAIKTVVFVGKSTRPRRTIRGIELAALLRWQRLTVGT